MSKRMIQLAALKQRKKVPPKRVPRRWSVLLGASLGAILLGLAPVACLSDLPLTECEAHGICAGSGGGGGRAEAGSSDGGSTDGGPTQGGAGGSAQGGGAGLAGGSAGNGGSAPGGGSTTVESGAGGESGAAGSGGICTSCIITPSALPAPCGRDLYSTTLHVTGGAAPYDWQITPPVDQWLVARDPASPDGSAATLTGKPAGPTDLTIEIIDATGKRASRNYSAVPRSACWFAYTALETAGPVLHLLDPILERPPPTPLANNQGVYDFHFSPNGRFLAYRFGEDADHPTGRHVALLDLSTWQEEILNFGEDAVTAFAWSPDSSVLAAAFTSAHVTSLGGVRLDLLGSAAPVVLTPQPAFIDSDLYWIGTNFVAFHAAVIADTAHPGQFLPSPDPLRTPFYAPLGASGFDAPVVPPTIVRFDPDVFLQPTDNGFFMIVSRDPFPFFYSVPASDFALASHFSTNLVSPSGHFSAELLDDQLQVYRAEDGDLDNAAALSEPDQGCPKLLAWGKDRERIACVADVTSSNGAMHGEIRIFDLSPSSSTLAMSTLQGYCVKDAAPVVTQCAALEYDYTEESAAVQARAFSATGKWFAFTTGPPSDFLYWADMKSQPIALKRAMLLEPTAASSGSRTALAFSPDDHYLLAERGSLLNVYDLTAAPNSGPGSDAFQVSQALQAGTSQANSDCSEDFLSAPDRWCGSADLATTFRWSPDSRFAAYQTPGSLRVDDFTQLTGNLHHVFSAPDCMQKCSGQFAFQPLP